MIATRPGTDCVSGQPIRPGDNIARVHGKRWRLIDPRMRGRWARGVRPGQCPNCQQPRGVMPAVLRTDAHGRPEYVCWLCSITLSEDLHFS